MLFRLDNPRLVMNAQEFPENMVLYCLAYAECTGDVVVNFIDPSNSRRVTQPIRPTRALSIFDGVTVNEYVLPFSELVDPIGRRGATSGFTIIGRSSYRVAGASYEIRTLEFTMVFPVIGGGIIRMRAAEQEWDIANPTFNPHATVPEISTSYGVGEGNEYVSGPVGIDNRRVPDAILINAYQRTHRGFIGQHGTEVEQRRQARLANFDLNENVAQPPPLERPIHTPAIQGRTSVVTGRNRDQEIMSSAASAAEERRQSRLSQIRQAEQQGQQGSSMLIGVDPGRGNSVGVSIIAPITRKPKAPPKSRFERIQENCEEAHDQPKK
jgi:hypothetical protein